MTNGWRQTPAPPWSALIITNTGVIWEEPSCSGTVIGDGWVLTAAHCVYGSNGKQLLPRNLRVLIGRDDRNATNQGAAYGIQSIYVMPGYVNGASNGRDAALIYLQNFDSSRWHALPISSDSSAIQGAGGVTLFGYGNTGFSTKNVAKQTKSTEVGAGTLWKSPDGAFLRSPSSDGSGYSCFSKTGSTQIMSGDSGASWLRWVSGAWQVIAVNDIVTFSKATPGNHVLACGTSPLASTSNVGETLLSWVRQTAALPIVAANSIVRDPASTQTWLVDSDGYRRSIPTGGDYNCFVGQGDRVINMARITIESIAERVGTSATCTPPPATVTCSDGSVHPLPFECPVQPPPPTVWDEVAWGPPGSSIPLFSGGPGVNSNGASGPAARIPVGSHISTDCRAYNLAVAPSNSGGYWYHIVAGTYANYWTPASVYENGDGPYPATGHAWDEAVRIC